MEKIKINIWDREFQLDCIMQCYPGKEPTSVQKDAERRFIEIKNQLPDTKEVVFDYINDYSGKSLAITDNIFRYVMPKSILIPAEKKRTVAIMCYFKFDMEHGLAVVFENEAFKTIGPEDIVL